MKGWVYIISNESFPGCIKIGHSSKDPIGRAQNLGTGSPYPYTVEYAILTHNYKRIEKQIHSHLFEKREGKEWFKCTIPNAVSVIKKIAKEHFLLEENHYMDRLKEENNYWVNEFFTWYENACNNTKNPLITKLTKDFAKLQALRKLNLSSCGISYIPNALFKLTSLTDIALQANSIKSLPECIGNLRNLNRINIADNKIQALPESICSISNLVELNIHSNSIVTLPENMGDLKLVKNLSLFNNKIKYLPDSIGKMESVENISMIGNDLSSLPDSFANLRNLKKLTLSYNSFSLFPECLFDLESLEELYIDYNKLSKPNIPSKKNFRKIKIFISGRQKPD